MKIAAVASIKSNKTNRIYDKSRQIQKNNFQQADSVSFKNKELSQALQAPRAVS